MKKTSLAFAAAVAATCLTAHADPKWTASGWRVLDVPSTRAPAEVRAELEQFKKGPNPWSASYNPLASFKSSRTSAEAQAEYVANREAVAAMNGEDSGAAYLAAAKPAPVSLLAGQPKAAQ